MMCLEIIGLYTTAQSHEGLQKHKGVAIFKIPTGDIVQSK